MHNVSLHFLQDLINIVATRECTSYSSSIKTSFSNLLFVSDSIANHNHHIMMFLCLCVPKMSISGVHTKNFFLRTQEWDRNDQRKMSDEGYSMMLHGPFHTVTLKRQKLPNRAVTKILIEQSPCIAYFTKYGDGLTLTALSFFIRVTSLQFSTIYLTFILVAVLHIFIQLLLESYVGQFYGDCSIRGFQCPKCDKV